ncbi:polyamine ABC transporter ATP-binding protein [Acuticoccus sediminis]|uniref:Polyamine ABC transporter ATP-binding protein n=1 Tax=Acuticoccus sediminis TaxID=2184697 RepID=A0A8B2NUU1_9HYPH|nr:ABC transporter ATP-binding protein [Acuticoccus sediminis]RAI03948.1 polyamine ABC transporter ATP-binding protein [Acuticoccus sediminis]
MADLTLDAVTKSFGGVTAVNTATLTVPEGEFVCLLGPSGCGKTTLLRMIAGLEAPTSGSIIYGGEPLNAVPAHQRDFGMVFQSLALFPHLTVGENIAYPLTIRGVPRARRKARVAELLDLVQLPGFERRAVSQLSGGQRQRIAIARALAVSPKLFLLDEPLSALDAKLREAMQVELRQLQRRLGITTIVVTHDQREAMTLADRIVVMKSGVVQQVGPPLEVYRQPANAFVADFIGQTNLFDVVHTERGPTIGGVPVALPLSADALRISVRPEAITVTSTGQGGIPADVVFVRDLGAQVEARLVCAAGEVIVVGPAGTAIPPAGETVAFAIDPAGVVILDDAP